MCVSVVYVYFRDSGDGLWIVGELGVMEVDALTAHGQGQRVHLTMT